MDEHQRAALQARLDEIVAARRELIRRHNAEVMPALARMVAAITEFVDAFEEAVDRPFKEHPDLVELNVTLDGFYGE